jgi:hypothetical protein
LWRSALARIGLKRISPYPEGRVPRGPEHNFPMGFVELGLPKGTRKKVLSVITLGTPRILLVAVAGRQEDNFIT